MISLAGSILEDVNILGREAGNNIAELEALFKIIKAQADEYSDIRRLASAGQTLAREYGDGVEALRDDVIQDIHNTSIPRTEKGGKS